MYVPHEEQFAAFAPIHQRQGLFNASIGPMWILRMGYRLPSSSESQEMQNRDL